MGGLLKAGTPRGRVALTGLADTVEIAWDDGGVPHIRATSLEDAVFAQAVVHARDRFWQMELNRRVGSGRLSEMLGVRTVAADRFLRKLGLRRAAQRDWEEATADERRLLEAYAAGVNAWIGRKAWRRPLELLLLNVRPEPWTPLDSLSWAKMMAFDLGATWETELLRQKLLERLGPERATLFHLGYSEGLPLTVPSGSRAAAAELLTLYREAAAYLPGGGASNAWAVSGRRTVSGQPLLASDPHLLMRLPSTWYECHLSAPDLDVFGVTLPGVPLVVLGRNRSVAWGATNAFADCQDLFIEEFREGRYRVGQDWAAPERSREVIRVRSHSPVVEEVVWTRHGPIMAGSTQAGTALALRWTGHAADRTVGCLLAMNRAGDAAELRRALSGWTAPALNFVYADTQDNIGYVMAGRIPVRAHGRALLPVPGGDGLHEWVGWLADDELPQAVNPSTGYVVTANNAVAAGDRHIGWDFMNGFRACRIEDLIGSKERLCERDFQEFQMDLVCLAGLRFRDLCRGLGLELEDPEERQVLGTLLEWDGEATPASAGAAVYEVLLLETVQQAYTPWLGEELVADILGRPTSPLALTGPHAGRYIAMLLEHLEAREGAALGLAPGPAPEEWRAVLSRGLARTTSRLRWLFPNGGWSWGALHRLRLTHALGSVRWLGWLLNGPEVAVGGDTDTVMQSAVLASQPYRADSWAPSWRMVADLASTDRVASILPSGQSGHWRNRHYLDSFPWWHAGRLRVRHLAEPNAVSRQRLEPS